MTPEQIRDEQRSQAVTIMSRDRRRAHQALFSHRHPYADAPFHNEMTDLIHSSNQFVILMVFRGSAKSTKVEEAITIKALLREFKNCLIVGSNETQANDRLRAIKHELETNMFIEEVFGSQVGATWQEGKIVLPNGIVIQARGQGQALRGTKHLDARPDYLLIDDLEDKDNSATKEARAKLTKWVYADLLPALEPRAKIRVTATPLDPEAWAVALTRDPDYKTLVIPIEYLDADGQRRSSWPSKFPMLEIDRMRQRYYRNGQSATWEQEYMCRAVDPATRLFTKDLLCCAPNIIRTWQPTYAIYDPARTTNKTSASTGRVVASWQNNRLIVWEASAEMWKPDEIISDMFRVDQLYNPIAIGVEEDGLHEFIMQPLRHEQLKQGHLLPIRPLKAPRGKLDFIKQTQPFFKAREVVFAGDRSAFEDAFAQFEGFPSGRIDVPNALAYMMVVRPGQPMYDGFSHVNIVEGLAALPRTPFFVALNASTQCTTAVLVELNQGALHILYDTVREGDIGQTLPEILQELRAVAGRSFTTYCPRDLLGPYSTVGLKAAARSSLLEVRRGGDLLLGRAEIRRLLAHLIRGEFAVRVSTRAPWTLRALSGGYAKPLDKTQAQEGIYRVLMEGLEAFAGTLVQGQPGSTQAVHYDTTADGRRYISARA